MADQPTVRLLSYTAYPLETLYVAAVSLDDPEISFQKPEEIRALLYSDLSKHLRPDLKEFIYSIVKKQLDMVGSFGCMLLTPIRFVFLLDGSETDMCISEGLDNGAESVIFNSKQYRYSGFCNTRRVWDVSLWYLISFRSDDEYPELKPYIEAAVKLIEAVDPYLYQLITEDRL